MKSISLLVQLTSCIRAVQPRIDSSNKGIEESQRQANGNEEIQVTCVDVTEAQATCASAKTTYASNHDQKAKRAVVSVSRAFEPVAKKVRKQASPVKCKPLPVSPRQGKAHQDKCVRALVHHEVLQFMTNLTKVFPGLHSFPSLTELHAQVNRLIDRCDLLFLCLLSKEECYGLRCVLLPPPMTVQVALEP